MPKTALIVDDSASARVVLSRILAEHALDVDTAESAEQALEYLLSQRPDVIFMDHLMPGMDGFQAVQAIKANPDTATIPIMMYTSQEGELYVGQARALGALGVLPKQVKPVEVSEVLKSLHLIPDDEEDARRTLVGEPPTLLDAEPDTDLGGLLKDLFQQQRALLREEIRDGYQQLALQRNQIEEGISPAPARANSGMGSGLGALILAVAAVACGFAYLYWETEQRWEAANARNARLLETLEQQRTTMEIRTPPESPPPVLDLVIDSLQWGVNQNPQYDFGELPLNDARADLLSSLLRRLDAANFAGVVQIDTHVGRYCLEQQLDGSESLPAPGTLASQCTALGFSDADSGALGERQSIRFANTVAAANGDSGSGINVVVISHGSDQPLVDYPPLSAGLSADDWNQTAAINNRVEITLIPE